MTSRERLCTLPDTRELKQQRRRRQRKRHLKINIWEMVTILRIIASSSHPYRWQSTLQMDWYERHWSKYREWKVQVVVYTLNLEILRCHLVDFVKELYSSACRFSTVNQWDHCFLVSSLLKLPTVCGGRRKRYMNTPNAGINTSTRATGVVKIETWKSYRVTPSRSLDSANFCSNIGFH